VSIFFRTASPMDANTDPIDANAEPMDVAQPDPIKVDLQELHARAQAAVEALNNRPKQSGAQKNMLFNTEEEFWELSVAVRHSKRLPRKPQFHLLPLKHPLWGPDTEVCFFSKKPRHSYKACFVMAPCVKKFIDEPRLAELYNTVKLRRYLMRSFPVFIADKRIYRRLVPQLGKQFCSSRYPQPIRISNPKRTAGKVKRVLNSTYVVLRDIQPTYFPKVGKEGFAPAQIADNVISVLTHFAKIVRGWHNVNTVYLKTTKSPAVPIYVGPLQLENARPGIVVAPEVMTAKPSPAALQMDRARRERKALKRREWAAAEGAEEGEDQPRAPKRLKAKGPRRPDGEAEAEVLTL